MTQTVTDAVAKREAGPGTLIKQYSSSFAAVLPSHIRSGTWIRLAQGALKRGKRTEGGKGPYELEVAAANDPGKFLAALLDAARLGLEPGSEQYYLTPRKVKGRLEILGIVGYQGHIELMYRAGAISAIVAEVVREHDAYEYRRGVDEVPVHTFRPFSSDAERGKLIGVYAYARMKDGAVSRVVELSADDIARIKESSQGSHEEWSPWVRHEAAMWLKSAVRQLQKWVPTSAEFRQEIARATATARGVAEEKDLPDPVTYSSDDAIDGEVIEGDGAEPEPDTDWPAAATPADAQEGTP